MAPATAYGAVLNQIDKLIYDLMDEQKTIFAFENFSKSLVEVRDFGTTGVVSFVEAVPFYALTTGSHRIGTKNIQINQGYKEKCQNSIDAIVNQLDI